MKQAEQLSFPLRVLEKIADHEKQLSVVDEILKNEPPGYVRMPDKRIDLLKWFTEHKGFSDDEVIPRVTPYVNDFDENSRFTAIEGLGSRDPARIAPSLIERLLAPEEESGRIKRTIVEVLERTKAPLGERGVEVGGQLQGPLANDYRVDGNLVKKK